MTDTADELVPSAEGVCVRWDDGEAVVRAVAFDLDGTLYQDGRPLPHAAEAVTAASAAGLGVVYLTNTSGQTRGEVTAALQEMGISASSSCVWTSAAATARWLAQHHCSTVATVGTSALQAEIAAFGIGVTGVDELDSMSAEQPLDALVVGLDRDAVSRRGGVHLPPWVVRRIARREALLVACNRDRTYPGRDGVPEPGCGVVVAQVERLCGRLADAVVGKPSIAMVTWAADIMDCRLGEILVVGDSPESDIAMAGASGSPWILVGVAGEAMDQAAPTVAGAAVDDLGAVVAMFDRATPRLRPTRGRDEPTR